MATVLPDWFHPGPREGWTADMLDHLPPDAPKHVDLIDGSHFTRSPQTNFHAYVVNLLIDRASGIRPPHHLAVAREMTVTLGERQRPEADVMAVSRTAASQPHRTSYSPDEVHKSFPKRPRNWTGPPSRASTPTPGSGSSGASKRKTAQRSPTPSSSNRP
ncbi:Uma2 family endonuclease [Nonomuraea sp. NPDC059023]|uniref:Uma2 family endonuclease n=1 Tax=unclassified Nonomuraea TaxID=2593643 RepID=UPI0036AD4BBD